jgi:hypothetical protein
MMAPMRLASAGSLLCFVALGCSSGQALVATAGTDGGVTGQPRLVPWQIEAEGAPPLVMGIYDSQQKALCRFLADENGRTRCLPWVTAPLGATRFSVDRWGELPLIETTLFADAACKKPIYRTDGTNIDPIKGRRMALPLARTACGVKRYAVGKLVDPPSSSRYGGTPCAPLPDAPGPEADDQYAGLVDLTIGDVESPSGCVEGTEVDGPILYGRLRIRQFVTAEGARFDSRLVDERWMRTCRLAVVFGEGVYCQPPTLFGDGLSGPAGHEGDQCSGKLVWSRGACDDPVFVTDESESPSFFKVPYFLVGAVWSGPVSSNPGHGCRPSLTKTTVDGPNVFVESGGAELDATAIMAPRPWPSVGTGRLLLNSLTDAAAGSVSLPVWLLFRQIDSVLNRAPARFNDGVFGPCNPARMPDGTTRCLPVTVFPDLAGNLFTLNYFADPQCKKPAYFGNPSGPLAHLTDTDGNGQLTVTSFEATEEVVTKIYSLQQGKDCVEAAGQFPPNSLFSAGAADTSWKDYPVLTERNAPLAPSP